MTLYNPEFDILTEYAQTLANLGGKHLAKALQMAQKALKLRPFDEDAKENRDRVQKLVNYRDSMRAVNQLLKVLKEEEKEPVALLDALPDSLQDSNLVITARHEYLPATKWPPKSIAIYVGQGPLGIWGPWSLDEGGIGGSEEAVVRLSRELAHLGWEITVFGMPGKNAGPDLGFKPKAKDKFPEWKQYWEINNKDTFDVLISWRQPGFFDYAWKARKTYLWLHDVVEKDELTPERLANITKVIYVSKYHSERPESDSIKPSQKLASGNGIDPSTFAKYDDKSIRRDNHRVIYMSANERGLRILLDIWPDVRAAVPDATLTPYYGWQSFDAVNRDNPERMAWKATMVARMKELPGVSESVRLGHDELTQEMFKSGIFAYPCFFPEVNCVTAQKAMAAGCEPVVSTFAVLDDIVPNEFAKKKVHMGDFTDKDIDRYKQALIDALQNPMPDKRRDKLAKWARDRYDWKRTAEQWSEEMS